ncbi:hypothetical protein K7X08_009457 [Anisodus acutangulus]|uniref:Uncharacterized protein n=1 Tax=Anisodus acutangulus TaxID=402998 RepID=A0A9Q1RU62_9SOLA|nr:hypothetical protein K7X08_009457 [Anisodus acutangulus]
MEKKVLENVLLVDRVEQFHFQEVPVKTDKFASSRVMPSSPKTCFAKEDAGSATEEDINDPDCGRTSRGRGIKILRA